MYDFYQKNGYGYIIPNGTVIITDCKKKDETIVVPSEIDGIKVSAIYETGYEKSIGKMDKNQAESLAGSKGI